MDYDVQSILVSQPGRYGDMILTTPMFRALHTIFPAATLTVLAAPGPSIIAELDQHVHETIVVGSGGARLLASLPRLRRRTYSLYVDPKDHRSSTSRLLARSVRAQRVCVAHPNAPARPGVLTVPAAASAQHYVDVMLGPARLLAGTSSAFERRPALRLPKDVEVACDPCREFGQFVVVNLAAGASIRQWPFDSWRRVIDVISRRFAVVVLSGGSITEESRTLAGNRSNVRPIATPTILHAAAIVARAAGILTPDTSLVHLASAFDIPTVALYPRRRDNLIRFAPLASRSAALMPVEGEAIAGIDARAALDAFEHVVTGEPAQRDDAL